jgi:hypothetical protein
MQHCDRIAHTWSTTPATKLVLVLIGVRGTGSYLLTGWLGYHPRPAELFQLSSKHTTDVSICEGETDSAILAEPPKSQDGKRTLLSPSFSRAGQSTAHNRT